MRELTFHNAEAQGDQIGASCEQCGHVFSRHEWIWEEEHRLFCSEQCADTDEDIARAEMMEDR